MGPWRSAGARAGEACDADVFRSRRRARRRRMGLSASGSSSGGDAEGDARGTRGGMGFGEGETLLSTGGPDLGDGEKDAEGEGSRGVVGARLGGGVLDAAGDGAGLPVVGVGSGEREGGVVGEESNTAEVEAPGGGGEDIAQSTATVGSALDVATAGGASRRGEGGRALVTAADRRAVLDDVSTERMMTLYGGNTVQHLGGRRRLTGRST